MLLIKRTTDLIKSLLLAILCAMTLTDYSLMKQCPNREKIAVVHTFFIFVLQLTFIFSLMTATLMIFLPQQQAMAVSALISLSVVAMEIKMISSLWSPQGILSEGMTFKDIGLLIIRLCIAFILASAYAISVELYIFKDDINEKAMINNREHNATLIENYQERLQDKKGSLTSLEGEIDSLEKKLQQYYQTDDRLASKLNTLVTEKIELERLLDVEEKGLEGRPKGKHNQYWSYHNDWSAKNKEILMIESERQALQKRYQSYDNALKKLIGQKEQLSTTIIDFDPYHEASQHPSFEDHIPTGLAARYRLLAELKKDPDEGATVLEFSWIIKVIMMTLELIPLIVKVFFTPASIYLEMLAAQTRREAAKLRFDAKKSIEAAYSEYTSTHQGENDSDHNEAVGEKSLA